MRHYSVVCAVVIVTAFLVNFAPIVAHAYSGRYALFTSSTGEFDFSMDNLDFCTSQDVASHTAMPTSSVMQTAIKQAYDSYGLTDNIPLGGGTYQATCTGSQCEWRWWRGLYRTTRPIFLRGVNYWGLNDLSSDSISRVTYLPGFFTNFQAKYPRSWANLSYWGKRLVVMQPSGEWINTEVSSQFTKFLCEYYVYADSDGVNKLMPTFPGGSVIPLNSTKGYNYTFCDIPIVFDSQGRWVLPQCGERLPWWVGLVIAVVCYIILVGAIITAWCCCCKRRRNTEEYRRRQTVAKLRDNQGDIPAQSELGYSHNQSFNLGRSFTYSAREMDEE